MPYFEDIQQGQGGRDSDDDMAMIRRINADLRINTAYTSSDLGLLLTVHRLIVIRQYQGRDQEIAWMIVYLLREQIREMGEELAVPDSTMFRMPEVSISAVDEMFTAIRLTALKFIRAFRAAVNSDPKGPEGISTTRLHDYLAMLCTEIAIEYETDDEEMVKSLVILIAGLPFTWGDDPV